MIFHVNCNGRRIGQVDIPIASMEHRFPIGDDVVTIYDVRAQMFDGCLFVSFLGIGKKTKVYHCHLVDCYVRVDP